MSQSLLVCTYCTDFVSVLMMMFHCFTVQVLSNVLGVVPWVIDFIVDSGWAQEIVRCDISFGYLISILKIHENIFL